MHFQRIRPFIPQKAEEANIVFIFHAFLQLDNAEKSRIINLFPKTTIMKNEAKNTLRGLLYPNQT